MKIAIIISTNDAETIWNGVRLANACISYDDDVTIFLLGKGVEAATCTSLKFNVEEQLSIYEEFGGKMIGCGVCCDHRIDVTPNIKESLNCPIGSMQDLYALIKDSDKIITF